MKTNILIHQLIFNNVVCIFVIIKAQSLYKFLTEKEKYELMQPAAALSLMSIPLFHVPYFRYQNDFLFFLVI